MDDPDIIWLTDEDVPDQYRTEHPEDEDVYETITVDIDNLPSQQDVLLEQPTIQTPDAIEPGPVEPGPIVPGHIEPSVINLDDDDEADPIQNPGATASVSNPDKVVIIISSDEESSQTFTTRRLSVPTIKTRFETECTTLTPFIKKIFGPVFSQGYKPPTAIDSTFEQHSTLSRARIIGPPIHQSYSKSFYRQLKINQKVVEIGDFVQLSNPGIIGRVISICESQMFRQVHVGLFVKARNTFLAHTADEWEIFPTNQCRDFSLDKIVDKKEVVSFLEQESRWTEKGGLTEVLKTPSHWYYRLMLDEIQLRFTKVSAIVKNPFGSEPGGCKMCLEKHEALAKKEPLFHQESLEMNGITYRLNDGVFLSVGTFRDQNRLKKGYRSLFHSEEHDNKRYPEYYRYFDKSGRQMKGNFDTIPDPLQIGIIDQILPNEKRIVVRAMYRPENTNMSLKDVNESDMNLLFWTDSLFKIHALNIEGKCCILPKSEIATEEPFLWHQNGLHRFYFENSYCPKSQNFEDLSFVAEHFKPNDIPLAESEFPTMPCERLKTLDLFSGAGGLSTGLEMSGCAEILWSIENDENASKAFKLNHPEALAIFDDANKVLKNAMDGKPGIHPKRGEVELICTGPPCQGFSGLNSFRDSPKAKFSNSMVATSLSYLDFYRPKFFLMENVKAMLSSESGMLFKLIFRAIQGLGYQVCVGVLQCGNYGVPQDRQRGFILATSPYHIQPYLPEPDNVFVRSTASLGVGKLKFHTNPNWKSSAPLRNVTAGEALSDLPKIMNGCNVTLLPYASPPKTCYQKVLRWNDELKSFGSDVADHICKEVSIIQQARISLIPDKPGADWRHLPNIIWQFPDGTMTEKLKYVCNDSEAPNMNNWKGVCNCMSGQKMICTKNNMRQRNTIIPWAMVHTARRNNHWSGCYSRVLYESYFSTVDTDPEPEGKQGRVVHPDKIQKRVFSVRELARAQGLPDSFKLCGALKDKYRQVGNAVPPPVARAIGLQIREALARQQVNNCGNIDDNLNDLRNLDQNKLD